MKHTKKIFAVLLILYGLFVAGFGYFFYQHNNKYETRAEGEIISVYWDDLEEERLEYDFSKIDAQLSRAKGNGLSATIALGFKLPSEDDGPAECNFPGWYNHEAVQTEKDKQLFQMLRTVVNQYEDNSTVVAWLLERDALKATEGCPAVDASLLDAEIALVEGIDDADKQIIVERSPASLADFVDWFKGYLR